MVEQSELIDFLVQNLEIGENKPNVSLSSTQRSDTQNDGAIRSFIPGNYYQQLNHSYPSDSNGKGETFSPLESVLPDHNLHQSSEVMDTQLGRDLEWEQYVHILNIPTVATNAEHMRPSMNALQTDVYSAFNNGNHVMRDLKTIPTNSAMIYGGIYPSQDEVSFIQNFVQREPTFPDYYQLDGVSTGLPYNPRRSYPYIGDLCNRTAFSPFTNGSYNFAQTKHALEPALQDHSISTYPTSSTEKFLESTYPQDNNPSLLSSVSSTSSLETPLTATKTTAIITSDTNPSMFSSDMTVSSSNAATSSNLGSSAISSAMSTLDTVRKQEDNTTGVSSEFSATTVSQGTIPTGKSATRSWAEIANTPRSRVITSNGFGSGSVSVTDNANGSCNPISNGSSIAMITNASHTAMKANSFPPSSSSSNFLRVASNGTVVPTTIGISEQSRSFLRPKLYSEEHGKVQSNELLKCKSSEENNESIASLKKICNPTNFDINPPFARFFIIKSYSEDDVHKSIKYGIWTSTDSGNRRLDNAFCESHSRGPIYLFFSVNASGHFCGMAEMLSALDYETKSNVWSLDKWNGQFLVKWIFIKDIPNGILRHIRLVNNENKPVTNSRDTQEVFLEPGKEMLKIFSTYKPKTSILDDFGFYDQKQEEHTTKRASEPETMMDNASITDSVLIASNDDKTNQFSSERNISSTSFSSETSSFSKGTIASEHRLDRSSMPAFPSRTNGVAGVYVKKAPKSNAISKKDGSNQ